GPAAGATTTAPTTAPAEARASTGDPTAAAGLRSRDATRVADPATALLRLQSERRSRTTDECDLLAVTRPRRAPVAVHARRDVRDFPRLHVVQTDERVVLAHADERDLRTVGRPVRLPVASPQFDEGNAAGVHASRRRRLR